MKRVNMKRVNMHSPLTLHLLTAPLLFSKRNSVRRRHFIPLTIKATHQPDNYKAFDNNTEKSGYIFFNTLCFSNCLLWRFYYERFGCIYKKLQSL